MSDLPQASGSLTAWHLRPLIDLGWSDKLIAEFYGRHCATIQRLRVNAGIVSARERWLDWRRYVALAPTGRRDQR